MEIFELRLKYVWYSKNFFAFYEFWYFAKIENLLVCWTCFILKKIYPWGNNGNIELYFVRNGSNKCMKYSDLQAVVNDQMEVFRSFDLGIAREMLPFLPVITSHALVITGIRRCGKSVLLHQFIRNEIDDVFYFSLICFLNSEGDIPATFLK